MGEIAFLLIPIGAFCWRAGGMGLFPLKKGYRRLLWPFLALLFMYLAKVPINKLIPCYITLLGAMHLGYGEGHGWKERILTAICLFIPFIILSPSFLMSIICIITGSGIFILNYIISLNWNAWSWGYVEIITGLTQGFWLSFFLVRL